MPINFSLKQDNHSKDRSQADHHRIWWASGVSYAASSLLNYLLTLEGYKFETLCLLPDTWGETPREYIENRESEIVNNHAQYCSVVRTGIGNTIMILGGEVDAGMSSSAYPLRLPLTRISLGF